MKFLMETGVSFSFGGFPPFTIETRDMRNCLDTRLQRRGKGCDAAVVVTTN